MHWSLVPSPAIRQVATEHVAPQLESVIQPTTYESRTLAELRDTLLPKLISGELRVPEAMEMAAEATA